MYALQSADRNLLSKGPANPTVFSQSLQEIAVESDVKWATTASFYVIPIVHKKFTTLLLFVTGTGVAQSV
jgi:hypothetical protein